MEIQMSTRLIEAIVGFFGDLERISRKHEEVTDTDVREALYLSLNYYFVWGKTCPRFPRSFGMFSAEGDRLVDKALRRFLEAARESEELAAVPVGQARLDLLQNSNIKTARGMQYDEFIGHGESPLAPDPLPEFFFLDGEYSDGAE
jgi:hypothetical protein